MDNETAKRKMLDFLNSNELGVISTIHTNKEGPESAVVGFGNTNDLQLIFGTSAQSRKYKNIQVDPHISFVIGWSSALGTLQYEGVAREISDDESAQYVELYMSKNESRKKFKGSVDQKYFIIEPAWIRYQDYASNPPATYELEF
jgi:pyridoxine/pyridoxamine 5'-phosphate oxidase